MTIFSGAQKAARDAKRRLDIDAIAKALEVNKTSSGYQAVISSWFSGGGIPYDPKALNATDKSATGCGANNCYYCLRTSTEGVGYCIPSDDANASDATPFAPGVWGTIYWIACANLETGSPAYYCSGSQQ